MHMLWFLNTNPNPNTQHTIYQVFTNSKCVYKDENCNAVYDLVNDGQCVGPSYLSCPSHTTRHVVKIKDHLISYETNGTQHVFVFKTSTIKSDSVPNSTPNSAPIFHHVYKPVGRRRMPVLAHNAYDLVCDLEMEIYDLGTQSRTYTQYVVETNRITGEKRTYVVTPDLDKAKFYHGQECNKNKNTKLIE